MKATIKYTTEGSKVVHLLETDSLVDTLNNLFSLETDPDAAFHGRQLVSITVTDEVEYVSKY